MTELTAPNIVASPTRSDRRRKLLQNLLRGERPYMLYIAFVVLLVVFSLSSPWFLSVDNFLNIGRQTTLVSIIAVGMTFVIIARQIDLSVASTLALSGMAATLAMSQIYNSWIVGAVATLKQLPTPLIIAVLMSAELLSFLLVATLWGQAVAVSAACLSASLPPKRWPPWLRRCPALGSITSSSASSSGVNTTSPSASAFAAALSCLRCCVLKCDSLTGIFEHQPPCTFDTGRHNWDLHWALHPIYRRMNLF